MAQPSMPEFGLPQYRIYPLNPAGRIGAPMDADCPDDAAAIRTAQELDARVRNGCEVWELTRFLGRFHFQPEAAAAPRV